MAYSYNSFYRKNTPKSAADKYKDYKYGTIAITTQPGKTLDLKTKEPYRLINLYNVDKDSAAAIVARLTDPLKQRITKNAWLDKTEPTHVQIKVFDKEIDQWLDGGDLNAIQSILLKAGYNADEVKHMEDEIATSFYSKDKEKIDKAHNEANENSMEMWQNYLSKINDPVTRSQIELYSRVYGNVSYGHILSIKNASLIKSYDKDATFVLAPGQWKNLFGRGIRRNAKPLPMYVWVPVGKATEKDIEDAKREAGWEQTGSEDLSTQVKNDINMKANKTGGFTLRSVGYDVRDTYLLSGAKEDKWSTEIGLLNNLSGELNQAAIADKQQRNIQNIDVDTVMEKRTEMAANWMEQFCQENGYDTQTRYQDPGNKLADYLLSYCTANATKKANILSQGNIQTYAENATQITLIITNLGLNALSRFHRTYEYSRQEATTLMNVVFGIAKKLEENSVINEGIGSWFRDKAQFIKAFLKALKMIGCGIKKEEKVQQVNNQELNTVIDNAEQTPMNQIDEALVHNKITDDVNAFIYTKTYEVAQKLGVGPETDTVEEFYSEISKDKETMEAIANAVAPVISAEIGMPIPVTKHIIKLAIKNTAKDAQKVFKRIDKREEKVQKHQISEGKTMREKFYEVFDKINQNYF